MKSPSGLFTNSLRKIRCPRGRNRREPGRPDGRARRSQRRGDRSGSRTPSCTAPVPLAFARSIPHGSVQVLAVRLDVPPAHLQRSQIASWACLLPRRRRGLAQVCTACPRRRSNRPRCPQWARSRGPLVLLPGRFASVDAPAWRTAAMYFVPVSGGSRGKWWRFRTPPLRLRWVPNPFCCCYA